VNCVRCHEVPRVDGARLCAHCLGEPMDDATYQAVQAQIQTFAGLLAGLDLEGFCDRLAKADVVGPIVDPTLYREALQSGKLELLKEHAGALRAAQARILRADAEFEAR